MRLHPSSWTIFLLVWAASQSGAGEISYLPGPNTFPRPTLGFQDQPPPAQPKQPVDDVFAEAPTAGGETPTGLNPRMIGDFPGIFVLRTITVPSTQTITQTMAVTVPTGVDSSGKPIFTTIQVPVSSVTRLINVTATTRILAGSSAIGFKVADNQSPAPGDRVYFSYNYFNNIQGPGGAFTSPQTITQQTTTGLFTTTVNTAIPGINPPSQDLHGELMGFEKSFLNGRASIGLRVPVYQQQGDGSFSQHDFGDMGVLFNYAFYLNRTTGSVLSGGILATLPTGPSVDTSIGNIHSTVLQPFVGYYWNAGRFYLLGFTSLAAPTDSRDVTFLFNDVGIGYWIYRTSPNQFLSAIGLTVEAHVATPMNHRNLNDPVSGFDEIDLTAGVNLGIFRRSMLTLGVCTPVTGPRPFNIEAIVQLNFSF